MRQKLLQELKYMMDSLKATEISLPNSGGNFYKVQSQQFLLPNGKIITREFLDKKPSAIILPITKKGNVVFVIQPIALSQEGVLIELPAGYIEKDETKIEGGIRELVEETGYIPQTIIDLGKHYQDPGSIKQSVQVFIALNCERKQKQRLDKDEYIVYKEIPIDEALELLDLGYITDANTFIALSKYDRYNKQLIKHR